MGNKRQFPSEVNWQSTNPATGFLPLNNNTNHGGSQPSGNTTGAMAGTNVIYSQIVDTSRLDNIGIEVNFNVTGGATGTLEVMGSVSGVNFYALTFVPPLAQPAGAGLGYLIDLNQYPWQYILLRYTNASGTGTMTAYVQYKDVN